MVKTVIFDIDGVVATFDFPSICREFERSVGISAVEVADTFDLHKEELLLGRMSAKQFFSELSKNDSRSPLDLESEWVKAGVKHVSLNQGMIELIRSLKKRCSVGVLSNASSLRKVIDISLDFYTEFDFTLFSCDEGTKKPNPDFFHLALKKASAHAQEAVFIDNRERHVSAAVALGMHGVVYSNNESLIKDLASLLPS